MSEQNDAAAELLEALKGVMRLIETGRLVRDISQDAHPDWALRTLEVVTILKVAQDAIDGAEKSP